MKIEIQASQLGERFHGPRDSPEVSNFWRMKSTSTIDLIKPITWTHSVVCDAIQFAIDVRIAHLSPMMAHVYKW